MRSLSICALFTLVAMAASNKPEKVIYDLNNAGPIFEQFIKDFNREYKDDADKELHFKAFVKNLEKVNKLNSKDSSATYGINKFADYTEEESKHMFGLKRP